MTFPTLTVELEAPLTTDIDDTEDERGSPRFDPSAHAVVQRSQQEIDNLAREKDRPSQSVKIVTVIDTVFSILTVASTKSCLFRTLKAPEDIYPLTPAAVWPYIP